MSEGKPDKSFCEVGGCDLSEWPKPRRDTGPLTLNGNKVGPGCWLFRRNPETCFLQKFYCPLPRPAWWTDNHSRQRRVA